MKVGVSDVRRDLFINFYNISSLATFGVLWYDDMIVFVASSFGY